MNIQVHDETEPLVGFDNSQICCLQSLSLVLIIIIYVCLHLASNALLTLIIYILVGLVILPIIYISFFTRGKRTIQYYLTNEIAFRDEKIKQIIIISLFTFFWHWLLSFLTLTEVIEHPSRTRVFFDVKSDIYMSIFYFLYIVVLPIGEEFFWRIIITKSVPNTSLYNIMVAANYGIINYITIICFMSWEYALIGGIYFAFIHICFAQVRNYYRSIALVIVSMSLRLGIILGFIDFN